MMDQLHAHHQVVIKEFAGSLAVGTNAANFRRQMNDHIRLGLLDHADDIFAFDQVKLGIFRHKNLLCSVFLELFDQVRAQKACTTRDANALIGQV